MVNYMNGNNFGGGMTPPIPTSEFRKEIKGERKEEKNENANLIKIVEKAEFDGTTKTKLTTTMELAKAINKLFRSSFSDFEGSIIMPDEKGRLEVSLYFKDKGINDKTKLRAIQPIGLSNVENLPTNSAMYKINMFNARSRNRAYELTQDAKDNFKRWMIGTSSNAKVNWNAFVNERVQSEYNSQVIVVEVRNLDLIKLLREIYGTKDSNGDRVEYRVQIIKGWTEGIQPMAPVQPRPTNFIINICQLNRNEFEKLTRKLGMYNVNGNIPMITD